MYLPNTDYELQTTFWMDFSIADRFGPAAVQDTFDRAFTEWKDNCVYLTELVMVLNHKLWQWYNSGRPDMAEMYNKLYGEADTYAQEHLTGEEADYYYRTTD